MTKQEMYLTWVNNAYAMEVDITKTLEGQLGDLKDYPEAHQKVSEHLEMTKRQAEQIKECIERNGGSVSAIQSGMASVMGMAKGVSMGMMHDKVIKNMIADFATEHFEIATYQTLIETAKLVCDTDSVPIYEQILKEEQEMAKIIETSMPEVLKKFLQSHT